MDERSEEDKLEIGINPPKPSNESFRAKEGGIVAFWMAIAFLIWIFVFRGFLSGKFPLIEDATSYYDHTKFFLDNLIHGIYPLWDPNWFNGVPNDFFLRRIGAFNPFYLIIIFFRLIGIPHTLAYLWFLAGYYFLGMVGFYLLAMRLYNNRWVAFIGFAVLLFSALGTRLFDSYMMLVTVPIIWFFYFLVAFTMKPKKHLFLGLVLSFMTLASTYIPFYFFLTLGIFVFCFIILYGSSLKDIARTYVHFVVKNKKLVVVSLLILAMSFLPLILFFKQSSQGNIALPTRHWDSSTNQVLSVSAKTLDWGIVEDLIYSSYFSDTARYKFAVVYVPFFACIIFALGLIGRINRRAVLLFLCGVMLLGSLIPHGLPFYDFLYKHLFILKYFRNLHFFLWFVLIPLAVLLCLEQLKLFIEVVEQDSNRRFAWAYMAAVHVAALVFVIGQGNGALSTYVMIFSSAAFFSLFLMGRLKNHFWVFGLLLAIVAVQPWETYHYFNQRVNHTHGPYEYDAKRNVFEFKDYTVGPESDYAGFKYPLYFASSGYNFLYTNMSMYALNKYLQNRIMLVDHVRVLGRGNVDVPMMEKSFLRDENIAYVFPAGKSIPLESNDPHSPSSIQRIDKASPNLKVLSFNADHLRLAVDLPVQKFMIYNDSYDPYWQVSVNGHPAQLYETNVAFKGLWLPAGNNVVEFHYGYWWQYVLNIFLLIAAVALLLGIIVFARGDEGEDDGHP